MDSSAVTNIASGWRPRVEAYLALLGESDAQIRQLLTGVVILNLERRARGPQTWTDIARETLSRSRLDPGEPLSPASQRASRRVMPDHPLVFPVGRHVLRFGTALLLALTLLLAL